LRKPCWSGASDRNEYNKCLATTYNEYNKLLATTYNTVEHAIAPGSAGPTHAQ
jgi:hypothetical protein